MSVHQGLASGREVGNGTRLCQTYDGARRQFFWQCGKCGERRDAPADSNTRMRVWLYAAEGLTQATVHVCVTEEEDQRETPAELLLQAAQVRTLTLEEISMIRSALRN